MSQRLAQRAAGALAARTTRRSFLIRMAVAGSALTVAPIRYLLRPTPAYAVVCGDCGGGLCCDGYTEFCCVLYGRNACPPGMFSGGWWKADGSAYCGGGPRYYVDCHAPCTRCGCRNGPFCAPGCTDCQCGCASCANRHGCCTQFRYGQCHQEIACVGPIACRVAACSPPYVWDATCTDTSATDNATVTHTAACLNEPIGDGELNFDENAALHRIDEITQAIANAVGIDVIHDANVEGVIHKWDADQLHARIDAIQADVAEIKKRVLA